MSQEQEINRFSEDSQKITRRHEPNRDLRTLAGILQNINVLIAMPSLNSGSFIAVAGEI